MASSSASSAPEQSNGRKRCWSSLLQDDADDDDDNDASHFKERRLEVASEEMPEPVLPERAMDTNNMQGPSGWIRRLQAALAPVFAQRKQQRDVIMASLCSGTGCPALALKDCKRRTPQSSGKQKKNPQPAWLVQRAFVSHLLERDLQICRA